MILGLYRALTFLGGPLVRLYLLRRRARGKEDRARFGERLGLATRPRPPGPLVWVHAASVGESLSLLPLVERLCAHPRRPWVLVTTGTVSSASLMAERLPPCAFHQYVPVDRGAWVGRFLDHWRPDLALWAESEFWPNLLAEAAGRRIPVVLINGRVSERSFRGWQRFPSLIRALLAGFPLCLGQTEADAGRLRRLGAARAECVGNLKFAAPPLPAGPDALAELRARIGSRPCWVAASTHDGEETMAGRIHARLRARHPGLITVVVPRHPPRGPMVADKIRRQGLAVARRSAGEPPTAATDVYVADTLGELGLFYRLAAVAFVGKSLVPLGGQNPLEPARLGCPVVHGPHMDNFADIVARMAAAGAVRQVADEAGLAAAVDALLSDGDARGRLASAGIAFAGAEDGVLARVLEALAPFLEALPPGDGVRPAPNDDAGEERRAGP